MWVQFLELDLKHMTVTSLSKLATILGTPLMVDKNTQEKNVVNFPRVLTQVPVHRVVP